MRYGFCEGNILDVQHMLSAGCGWKGGLTPADVYGIAAAWGHPADDALSDQYVAEVFYRLQVSPDIQLSLGYQLILEPALNAHNDTLGVFWARWRLTF